jgi:hypothetical protein
VREQTPGSSKRTLTAEKLLRHYPQWWAWCRRQSEEQAEEIAWLGYSAELQAVFRKGGLPGNPTFRRVLRLMETNELSRAVRITGEFINGLKKEEKQRVLIGVWRMQNFGWDWVARSAGLSVPRTMTAWTAMVRKLERRLQDAGCTLLAMRAVKLGGVMRSPERTDEGGEGDNGNRGRRETNASGGV